ncbi:Uncharacterised protein [BD1-7 clade bacterium]|uniref:DUF1145 domain-containing protein n=1 Tax=BD1-7 clade bacterium TaxID=2029982 RepID=A0A5S9N447_9GAMM|nr:Uncharacterised protein [BD1-7 clade bacterium]
MVAAFKIATAIGWLAIVANWLFPFGGQMQEILHWSGIFLAAAHAVEVFVFLPKAKRAGGNLGLHAVQLFLFGYAHNMALDQQLAATTA